MKIDTAGFAPRNKARTPAQMAMLLATFGLSQLRMPPMKSPPVGRAFGLMLSLCFTISHAARAAPDEALADKTFARPAASVPVLGSDMKVGDVVFIRVNAKPFREVADATSSWTNHVGIVVDTSGAEPMIGESKFPFSRKTRLSDFVARSEGGRVSVARLQTELTSEQDLRVTESAKRRYGILYDTGFDLHSRRQFCSRYVHEVLMEATGSSVGEVETFSHLLASRPDANVGFWKVWFFGSIPWNRETVTPASLLRSPALRTVFDGIVVAKQDLASKLGRRAHVVSPGL